MNKKQQMTAKKESTPALPKETLRRLDPSELRGVAGGGRLRVPIGYEDDGTPIYE